MVAVCGEGNNKDYTIVPKHDHGKSGIKRCYTWNNFNSSVWYVLRFYKSKGLSVVKCILAFFKI